MFVFVFVSEYIYKSVSCPNACITRGAVGIWHLQHWYRLLHSTQPRSTCSSNAPIPTCARSLFKAITTVRETSLGSCVCIYITAISTKNCFSSVLLHRGNDQRWRVLVTGRIDAQTSAPSVVLPCFLRRVVCCLILCDPHMHQLKKV